MSRIKLALVGLGKIARDEHIPALAGSDELELVAAAGLTSELF
jgi:D-galactose 1-dehydrogenase